MIIDVHGHVTAPDSLYAWKANLLAHRGAHGVRPPRIGDDELREAWRAPQPSFGDVSHLDHLDAAGSQVNPDTGGWYDDIHTLVNEIDWLSDGDRTALTRRTRVRFSASEYSDRGLS